MISVQKTLEPDVRTLYERVVLFSCFRNFEESEDELREAVADSMKNLFVPEDGSSDEESTEGRAALRDGTEDGEDGGADSQQIQPEVEEWDAAARPTGVVSCEGDGRSECSGDNAALNTQHQTS